jgi:hypothetical protein
MSNYGLRIKDDNGNVCNVTSDFIFIVDVGNIKLLNELKNDSTYGNDITLPTINLVDNDDISVILDRSGVGTFDLGLLTTTSSSTYMNSWYMVGVYNFTYYTKNNTTGVMTAWTPGNHATTWDELFCVFPTASWDKLNATEFSKIRLFSSMLYLAYDSSASTWVNAHCIADEGISEVDYAIAIRHHMYGVNYIKK